jgi:SSS family solute:Na+ symporter
MPILSAFIVGLLFKHVDAKAAIGGVLFGIVFYGGVSIGKAPFDLHYIHMMFITLWLSVGFSLAFNRWILGNRAVFAPFWREKDELMEPPPA